MHRLGSIISLSIAVAVALPARGDVASEAGFFDALARRAYRAGRYAQALEAFQLVQEIAPSPGTLYNAALCADLAKRSDMAFALYQEYLQSHDPDAARRAEALKRIEALTRDLALVAIVTEPAQAAVYLDRKELGRFALTPATIAVAPGEHRLLLERPDHAAQTIALVAERGVVTTVRVKLEPLYGFATLHVTPGNAQVAFQRDGAPVAAELKAGRYHLAAGQYQVRAEAPGHVPAQAQLLVREDGEARLDLGLVPLPRETGRLLVSTGGVAADVYVDGKRVAVTPATLSEIGPGQHSVEVRAGERTARRTVTVRAGRAVHLAIELSGGSR